jgi:magnesium transporter
MATLVQVYRPSSGIEKLDPADQNGLRAALADPAAVTWIIADGTDEITVALMRDVLALHPLTIEDICADRPHAKIDDFADYLYLIAHGIDQEEGLPHALRLIELDIVLGARFVLSHQSCPMRSVDAVKSEIARGGRIFEKGPAWIVHALLDHLIDHYLPLMDAFDDAVDEVENESVTKPTRESLQRIFALKRNLMTLRRVAVHQREILLRLSRGEFALIPRPLFRSSATCTTTSRVSPTCATATGSS